MLSCIMSESVLNYFLFNYSLLYKFLRMWKFVSEARRVYLHMYVGLRPLDSAVSISPLLFTPFSFSAHNALIVMKNQMDLESNFSSFLSHFQFFLFGSVSLYPVTYSFSSFGSDRKRYMLSRVVCVTIKGVSVCE